MHVCSAGSELRIFFHFRYLNSNRKAEGSAQFVISVWGKLLLLFFFFLDFHMS